MANRRFLHWIFLTILLPSAAHAENAEILTLHVNQEYLVSLTEKVDRYIVTDEDIFTVTQPGHNVIQITGKREGRAMLVVWSPGERVVFVVNVERSSGSVGSSEFETEAAKARPAEPLYRYQGNLYFAGVFTAGLRITWRPNQGSGFQFKTSLNDPSPAWPSAGIEERFKSRTNFSFVLSYAYCFFRSSNPADPPQSSRPPILTVSTFLDSNENGRRDAAEIPIANVPITVNQSEQFFTDERGEVVVHGLQPGNHTVFANTARSPATRMFGFTTPSPIQIELPGGEQGVVSFGLSDRSTLVGRVFNDLDLDGDMQRAETGLDGVQVRLLKDHEEVDIASTANGRFSFRNIPPASYRVELVTSTLPPNFKAERNGIEISLGVSQLLRVEFPITAHRSVGGTIFIDQNNDNTYQVGETVVTGALIHCLGNIVESNSEGRFLVRRLPAGNGELRIDHDSLGPGLKTGIGPVLFRLPISAGHHEIDLPVLETD